MPNHRPFLSRRRLLAIAGVLVLLFGLAMLHPYPRQSLFGPTIRGKPWCVWENEMRSHAYWDERQKTSLAKMRQWAGFQDPRPFSFRDYQFPEMLPLLLVLTESSDPKLREYAKECLLSDWSVRDRSALPFMRSFLNDNEAYRRRYAGEAVWRIDQDPDVIRMLQVEINGKQSGERGYAASSLASMYHDAPDSDLRAVIVSYAKHTDPEVRRPVLWAVGGNAEGIPMLLEGLKDGDPSVRACAARRLGSLRAGAIGAVPALERCLADADDSVRSDAGGAIMYIDWVRYVELQEAGKIK